MTTTLFRSVEAVQRRGFKNSCVTKLAPLRVVEESTALPTQIHPAFAGSGILGCGIDASGLQSLETSLSAAFGLGPGEDSLYILRHGYIGDALSPKNFLPDGYLSWSLRRGDRNIDGKSLLQAASLWQRTVDLRTASVETEMILDFELRLRIRVFVPFGSNAVHLEFGLRGYDRRNLPLANPHPVELSVALNLTLRDGSPIFTRIEPAGNTVALEAVGHDHYSLRYRWQHDAAWRPTCAQTACGLVYSGEIGNSETVLRCAIDFAAPAAAARWDYADAWRRHCADWDAYWARMASIEIGDVEREFLFANSLYLLRSGHDYAQGGVAQFLIQHQPYWHACTFWDMHFVSDGLIRAGGSALVTDFVRWLARVARPAGRTFPWMMIHDGSTPLPADQDLGVVVNLAFATAALRLHRELSDEELLREAIWPVCDKVCRYMAEDMFAPEDGRFILAAKCGHDVGNMAEALVNETYTAVWAVSVLAASLQIARQHGFQPSWAARAEAIVAAPRFENDGTTYLHARNVSIRDFSYASWVPSLLYPTEALSFLDRALFERTRALTSLPEIYLEKQNDYQPWTNFWSACSDLRLGRVESAEAMTDAALDYVFGPGYFCEVGPGQWGNAIVPPYSTPHGAYLTTISEQLFFGSFWERKIGLFTNIPSAWRGRRLQCRGLHSGNGVTLDAVFDPHALRATLFGNGNYVVECAIPAQLEDRDVQVRLDGQDVKNARRTSPTLIQIEVCLQPGGQKLDISAAMTTSPTGPAAATLARPEPNSRLGDVVAPRRIHSRGAIRKGQSNAR